MLKNITKYALTLLLVLPGIALAEKKDAPESIEGTTRVSAEQVIDLVEEMDDLVIIDSRIEKDRTGGHIEGAIALPDVETTPEKLAQHIPSKSTPVVFYCNGVKCGRSVAASKMAVAEGYSKVYWFRGGWEEWTEKGLPISKD